MLKHSNESQDYKKAANEWEFSGSVTDHIVSNQICQLCEGENLRYHFEVINRVKKHNSLMVGSSCIKKFDITVYDESGEEIFGKQRDYFLKKKIDEKKQEVMLDQVRSLWKKASSYDQSLIEYYVKCYQRENAFYPEDLANLFGLMKNFDIEFAPTLYKVLLKGKSNLRSLLNMSKNDQDRVLPCLTAAQKKRFSEKKKIFEQEKIKEQKLRDTRDELNSSLQKKNKKIKMIGSAFKKHEKPSSFVDLPEYLTCSICGDYTDEWATFNPVKCRKCLDDKFSKDK
ncbi:MAG: hypothetical protein KQH63_04500 [Desulfobulbaceae bacterium]|nr:hypothetical protein [Desulfobulbaceae bacterium]